MTVTHTRVDDTVTVTTVTAGEDGWRANSHLLILPHSVVLVDAPLLDVDADVVAAEIAASELPLTQIIITHPHPDHFATAARFGVPVRALPDVAASIRTGGGQQTAAAYSITGISSSPPTAPTVDGTIAAGAEIIDGILFEYAEVRDAEAHTQLIIRIPGPGIVISGDLVFANVHPFLAGRAFDSWITALQSLASENDLAVFPGHGVPGANDAISATIAYLRRAQPEVEAATNGADLDARLDAAFPSLGGRRMHALQDWFLFRAT